MKKNVLALSITAAVVSFGFAGGVNAMTVAPLTGASATSSLQLNEAGVGHSLFVPYFSAQDKNNTLINLVNTDTVNGKAVKVRFRGAANSDDLFDFQVFLSPGDHWSASVSIGADGLAKLFTPDASCTKPDRATLNSTPFLTARLDPSMSGDALKAGTREGYVEIFTMGDVPRSPIGVAGQAHPTQGVAPFDFLAFGNAAGPDLGTADNVNDLYTAIKHVAKVAPCSGAAWTALDAVVTDSTDARAKGLLPPSTGLMANWTIINVVGAAAWSGEATAIHSVIANPAALSAPAFLPALGHTVYWPQIASAAANPDNFTADPLFRLDAQKAAGGVATLAPVAPNANPAIAAGNYDLPDMSTPYTDASVAPIAGVINEPLNQAFALTQAIATRSVTNEFLTDPGIAATTDWVFSMPTRRYSVAFHYGATISANDDGRRFSEIIDDTLPLTMTHGYFLQSNTVIQQASATQLNGRQICVTGIARSPRDREETATTASTQVVISPSTLAPAVSFCGEASVLSINGGGIANPSGSLKSTVTRQDATVPFVDGWMTMTSPSATTIPLAAPAAVAVAPFGTPGLPVLGAAFARAVGGANGNTFGATWKHRSAR